MTVRLIFAFLFQWTVSAAGRVLAWIIPDRPRSLDLKIKRQEFLAKEALRNYKIKTGKRKAERDVYLDDVSEDEDDDRVTNRSPHPRPSAPYATSDNDQNINDESNSCKVKNRKKSRSSTTTSNNRPTDKSSNSLNRKSSLNASTKDDHHIDIINNEKENANNAPLHRYGESGNSATFPNGRERVRKTSKERTKKSSQKQQQQRPSSWNGNNTEMQNLNDGNNTLPSKSPKYSFDYLTQML